MIDTSTPLKIADNSKPGVILGSTHHCSLGIMRSLGRPGITVFGVDESRWAPAFFSRYCQGRFIWDLDDSPPAKSVEYLADIARGAGRRCVLIPTTDLAAIFVSDQAEALAKWFIFPSQSPALVRSLYSKKKMHDLARKLGVPTPITLCPETGADLRHLAENVDFPVILKATGHLRELGSKTKLILRTRREFVDLRQLPDRGRRVPQLDRSGRRCRPSGTDEAQGRQMPRGAAGKDGRQQVLWECLSNKQIRAGGWEGNFSCYRRNTRHT